MGMSSVEEAAHAALRRRICPRDSQRLKMDSTTMPFDVKRMTYGGFEDIVDM
jgi:uncharacterized protein YbaA (DUF1428 family)